MNHLNDRQQALLSDTLSWMRHTVPSVFSDRRDLHLDSRRVKRGDVFIAVRGEKADGRDYLSAAAANGAIAALVEADGWHVDSLRPSQLPVRAVEGLSGVMGSLAAEFYRHPANICCRSGSPAQWQDVVNTVDRAAADLRGQTLCSDWHSGNRLCRRAAERSAVDDPGLGVVATRSARVAGCRCTRAGDGSVFDRVAPRSHERHEGRRRALHQPYARPPRLSRHDAAIRSREGFVI